MGRAWADNSDMPEAARIIVGDFCFFAGNAFNPQSEILVQSIPEFHDKPWILMIPKDKSWNTLIENSYAGAYKKYMRYAFTKNPDIFDSVWLNEYIDILPEEYKIMPIDEPLLYSTASEKWSQDLCSQFSSYKEYSEHGLGFVILREGNPVCGASSYTYYDSGIEIEIDTIPEYRRRGLATACAAKLILACVDKGLYPSWDAANLESVALAKKLGYKFEKEYVTYAIALKTAACYARQRQRRIRQL